MDTTTLVKTIANIHSFLHQAEKLKMLLRHSWLSDGRRESVAEHTWRMALMAVVLSEHLKVKVNLERVLIMVLIHDLPEIIAGDEVAFIQKFEDKQGKERMALKELVSDLDEKTQELIAGCWEEFEEHTSNEAKFAVALDKLEVLIEHNEADLSTWVAEEFDLNHYYAYDKVEWNDTLTLLRDLILEETIAKIDNEPTL